ncbi:MAG: phosphoribosylformylglycinamidine synthase subunit PurS [Nitrososphaerota archaeon]|uniref:phosphoribosylformylglycinamidine synthase subunit PurS n=2 Tax=Candidatus Bathycorpusculum sp. TaxID=2994959 RepID=UPI0028247D2B|nr:phosphoribosylformylglycinamidine synthase subunit PurS [Candidatus Termiticorpusculum sp.]MCL2292151.1 phosphoribosylformylglycinamidine synthase subunit PurS [Candidatus Termiticorpusculum sp.]MDR0460876.1 phosphoribosylformylglycinamidine synthase subunit PurS [Nitrososphaerota archaeon]
MISYLELMKYIAKVDVSLKSGHINSEGETIEHLLKELGYQVEKTDVSKVYTILLQAPSAVEAKVKAQEISERLLANPAKDNYIINVVEAVDQ